MCFARNGGYFSIGAVNTTYHLDEIKYLSYENTRNLYSVKLMDILINRKDTYINSEYFTVIDSGTTVSYFPRDLYSKLKKEVNEFCSQINKCLGDSFNSDMGICFRLKTNINYLQFRESMPNLNFIFENDINYEWNPENYLFNNTEPSDSVHTYCMGFISWK